MSNITPKHVFLILVAAAILIPLLIFGWNELQTQPLDIAMNAVKITADGRVFDEGEICIRGAIKKELFKSTRYLDATELRILDKEFPVDNDNAYIIVLRHGKNRFSFTGLLYDPETNASASIDIIFPEDRSWCIVELGGKNQEFYFVGSTDTNPDYLAILESSLIH